jgi:hypothetical protein
MNHVSLCTKVKYPHWYKYLKNAPKEKLLYEINLLNKVATMEKPPTNLARSGLFVLISVQFAAFTNIPFGVFVGILYLIVSWGNHHSEERQTERNYYEFAKKLTE